MSAFTLNDYTVVSEEDNFWMKSFDGNVDCVFKKCCKSYKNSGKRCKKCPKK
ncbi:hypothetical protein FHS68_004834 [Dyadobacter arcticus]|uniref:Uncharacterized protein n=1 Tax=Dyadobacter arcticus TaxID=1078754 RepID=A0ABX0UVJ8_9BACT|nr:hypothetical protein [Dyadobacter arcticus]